MNIVKKKPLDASLGKNMQVMAPWGTMENAWVYNVADIYDGRVRYAVVFNPTGNFKVRCSVFRLTD